MLGKRHRRRLAAHQPDSATPIADGSAGRGRVVVLTGAAGGIGRTITGSLLANGHCVAAVDRSADALGRLLDDLAGARATARLHPVLAELGDASDCEAAVAQAHAHFGRVEAVINNAGIGVSSLRADAETRHPVIEELDASTWDRFLAVNVRAPALTVRAALPHMRAAGWGRIINNTTSFMSMLRLLPYGATKAALEAMSAVWAKELNGSGITVNVLVPGGPTNTAFIAEQSGIPRDGMLEPSIMGPPACWLLSDASNGMTGQRLVAARWNPSLPASEAAAGAASPIGWPGLAADVVWPASDRR